MMLRARPSKSAAFQVTSAALRDRVMAAICASNCSTRPARFSENIGKMAASKSCGSDRRGSKRRPYRNSASVTAVVKIIPVPVLQPRPRQFLIVQHPSLDAMVSNCIRPDIFDLACFRTYSLLGCRMKSQIALQITKDVDQLWCQLFNLSNVCFCQPLQNCVGFLGQR